MTTNRPGTSFFSQACFVTGVLLAANNLGAQEPPTDPGKPVPKPAKLEAAESTLGRPALPETAELATEAEAASTTQVSPERLEKFAQYMTGVKLKGRFTILGRDDKMPEETYTISKCEKLTEGNLYRFTARIQYGDTDTELPMDLPVIWAGDTPVITLTKMWLPGLGTFSSRVLIYDGAYAGTWQHDDVGGHLFGVIEKDEQPAESKSAESK